MTERITEQCLTEHGGCQDLDISSSRGGPDGWAHFALALTACKSLRRSNNLFTQKGNASAAAACNPVFLFRLSLGDCDIGADIWQTLDGILPETLVYLNLDDNRSANTLFKVQRMPFFGLSRAVAGSGAVSLCPDRLPEQCLEQCTKLTHISLNSLGVTDSDFESLYHSLQLCR